MFPGKEISIRKFVLESTIENGEIVITDSTEEDTADFVYDGDMFCFPVGEDLATEDFFPVKLERRNEKENVFSFPEDFYHRGSRILVPCCQKKNHSKVLRQRIE